MAEEHAYKIGEVAERTGVTTRTIRYYEELGLLGSESEREKGRHRLYCDTDVARLQELIRLRDLLGVSLDELRCLLATEQVDEALRARWETAGEAKEQRAILEQALANVDAQLELVCARYQALQRLQDELGKKRRSIQGRLRALSGNRNTKD
jgi:MerR family transcriptional regulator, repressor of the yfmOP operon